jgi:hypothetical protein
MIGHNAFSASYLPALEPHDAARRRTRSAEGTASIETITHIRMVNPDPCGHRVPAVPGQAGRRGARVVPEEAEC